MTQELVIIFEKYLTEISKNIALVHNDMIDMRKDIKKLLNKGCKK